MLTGIVLSRVQLVGRVWHGLVRGLRVNAYAQRTNKQVTTMHDYPCMGVIALRAVMTFSWSLPQRGLPL